MIVLDNLLKTVENLNGVSFSDGNKPCIVYNNYIIDIDQIEGDGEVKYESEVINYIIYLDMICVTSLECIRYCIEIEKNM